MKSIITHMFSLKPLFRLVGLPLGLFTVGLAQAQTATGSLGTVIAQPDSIVQITAESLGLSQVAFDQLPVHGTYWLAMPGGSAGLPLAPSPIPPVAGAPIYAITGNSFLWMRLGNRR
jgi:hypothetical protein